MDPTVYDIRTNADAERFQLSTTQAGRWDPNRSERDYLLTRRIPNRGGATPKIIVLHIQVGKTIGSLDSWVNDDKNPGGKPRRASSTVTVQKDGSILRVIPEEHGPWSNGPVQRPTPKGQDIVATFGPDPNAYTLSIEAEGQPNDEMLPEQLDAVLWQIEQWMRRYNIPLERVVRHADFDQVDRDFCPGRYYDQVMARLKPRFPGQASPADVPESRDWKDARFDQANEAGELPKAHTLIDEMPVAYNEAGRFGTSTAQVVAGCIAHRVHKQNGEWLQLSRPHIYYVGRERQYGKNEEELCSHESVWLLHVMEAMKTTGACREEVWPFDMDNLCPLPSAVENAPKVSIAGYWDMSNETPFANPGRSSDHQKLLRNHIMRCILTGCPVMFAIQLYDTFEPQRPDHEIPMPKPEDSEWMQHCMIIYGYDLNQGEHGMYKVQNSWGAEWGFEGKCRIPMKYIDEQGRDFCSLRRAPN